jgi:hypothetical protein
MVVDPKDFNVYTGKMYMVMLVCFAFSGTMAMMQFLHTKPIPDLIQTETTVKRIEVEATREHAAPPAQTITTVKETKITASPPSDSPKEGG